MKKVINALLVMSFCMAVAIKGSSFFLCLKKDSLYFFACDACSGIAKTASSCCQVDKPSCCKADSDTDTVKCCRQITLDFDATSNIEGMRDLLSEKSLIILHCCFQSSLNTPPQLHNSDKLPRPAGREPPSRQCLHRELAVFLC